MKSKNHIFTAMVVSAALILVVVAAAVAIARKSEPLIEMKMVYEDSPAHWFRDMKLVWGDASYYVTNILNAKPGREIGYATDEYSTWRIYELKGRGRDYLFAQESEDVWRVMSVYPPAQPWRQYILENATDSERFTKMTAVTLYSDGTAILAEPPISSYALISPCYYSFVGGELLIHYGMDDIIARFEVADDKTIIFRSATVPLFADKEARYVALG